MTAITVPLCVWCKEPLPARDPMRCGTLLNPADYQGLRTPIPARVCGPWCPQRPDGTRVIRIGRIGL